ncbi:hypothetical protein A2960_04540 [Candidatus Gottesmanbacteria bacterium RIFCSPLOWO2_01_FULL_39_12b]|uniref:SGNH hydrolase-type esterase domain-containing protein n=1 Tax=Candidatus Gottesmanbacteria bacterium RIFCSPLOWO2_01_FULL_39_12b TaxID=1798388 RepID=A0A1F6ANF5_9BACT|nr:MAG: hypothetical protein A2960_04540 [Candidatus Gottesmanbacteria bacterium RIFCSPLOWO2_01_FULL_39_12b]
MQIFVFGDSIAWGAWDTEGGWVTRIKKHVNERVVVSKFKNYDEVIDLGVSGNDTNNLLARFENELTARLSGDALGIIFAIGTNDSFHMPPEQFTGNLKKLISLARKYTDKIVFVGLPPVNKASLVQSETSYTNDSIKKYNSLIINVCKKENLDFIGIFDEFAKTEISKLIADGLHPNDKGHEIIAEVVEKHLHDKKWV